MPRHPREHFEQMRSQHPTPDSVEATHENMTASIERGLDDSAAGRTVDLGDFTDKDWFYVRAESGGWQVEGFQSGNGPWSGRPDIVLRVEAGDRADSVAQHLADLLNGDRYETVLTQPWPPLPLYRAVITDRELQRPGGLPVVRARHTGPGHARTVLWASEHVKGLEASDRWVADVNREYLAERFGTRP